MPIPFKCFGCRAVFEVPDRQATGTALVRCVVCDGTLTAPNEPAAGSRRAQPAAVGAAGAARPSPATQRVPKPTPAPPPPLAPRPPEPAKAEAPPAPAPPQPAAKSEGNQKPAAGGDEKPKKKKKKKDEDPTLAAAAAFQKKVKWAGTAVLAVVLIGVLGYILKPDPDAMKEWRDKGGKSTAEVAAAEKDKPKTPDKPKPAPEKPKPAPEPKWQAASLGGLTCEMPGTPTVTPLTGDAKACMLVALNRSYTYAVVSFLPPADFAGTGAEFLLARTGEFEKSPAAGAFADLGFEPQLRVTSQADIQQNGFPGKEYQLAADAAGAVVRFVLVGRRVYAIGVRAAKYADIKPQAQRFLASVKVAKTTDDSPPVVSPKPPEPPAGEVPGNLRAKLSTPFYAGAFDAEKGELVVVGLRPAGATGTRQSGTLQRYSYPDFKLLGTVLIPSVATRAQLDPANGLLYVTTAPTATHPEALSGVQFDRPALQGDVAVYDLAPLRAGKVEEKAEYKPVATIPVGRVVRDLALSADGKMLFILTLPATPKGKSQLLQVSTDERKVAKAKDLPDPGWDLVWSGNGEKLYVSGAPSGVTPPQLMVIDPVALALEPGVPLPNTPFHTAVSRDGRVVVSSPPAPTGAAVGGAGGGVPPVPGATGRATNVCELHVLDATGEKAGGRQPGLEGVSNDGYVAFTPDGKLFLVSSHHPRVNGSGFDVYQTSDRFVGDKKVATLKKAGDALLGGTFLVSPDSKFVVFNNGVVLALDDLGGAAATSPPVKQPDAKLPKQN